MSTFYKCDRCGVVHDNFKDLVRVNIPMIGEYNRLNLDDLPTKPYDLDSRCLLDLNKFMKSIPEAKEL
jgi:hypothetical protein